MSTMPSAATAAPTALLSPFNCAPKLINQFKGVVSRGSGLLGVGSSRATAQRFLALQKRPKTVQKRPSTVQKRRYTYLPDPRTLQTKGT
jgi:hypothetical protein